MVPTMSAASGAGPLVALPAFDDNYIWLLHDGAQALVVDPGEATGVEAALRTRGLQLAGILVTHHHGDHVGGIEALRARCGGVVYGPACEPIPGPYVALHGGDQVAVGGFEFEVIDVPGHTAGHIAYFRRHRGDGPPVLFCGDTLFSAGCGRLFEGTAAQMQASLAALAALPGDTQVCCAHEYTLSNLRFARAVEPGNAAIEGHIAWCEARRACGEAHAAVHAVARTADQPLPAHRPPGRGACGPRAPARCPGRRRRAGGPAGVERHLSMMERNP